MASNSTVPTSSTSGSLNQGSNESPSPPTTESMACCPSRLSHTNELTDSSRVLTVLQMNPYPQQVRRRLLEKVLHRPHMLNVGLSK
jgi:hypothetical protein